MRRPCARGYPPRCASAGCGLATGLIDKLSELGIRVIVISGYASVPILPGKAAAILQKPLVESQLLAALLPLAKRKRA